MNALLVLAVTSCLASAATAPPAAPAGRPPSTKPATTKPAPKPVGWTVNQKVEVKWGGLYRQATIVSLRSGWYLVGYDKGPFKEWVEPWRVRAIGSKDDPIDYARPNPTVRSAKEPPPAPVPGPAPQKDAPVGGSVREQIEGMLGDDLTRTREREAKRPSGSLKITRPWGATETLLSTTQPITMRLPPDAERVAPKKFLTKPITLKGAGQPGDDSELFFSAPEIGIVAVTHRGRGERGQEFLRIERVNLVTGASLATLAMPFLETPLAFSDDGTLLACHNGESSVSENHQLDIWTIASGQTPKHFVSFECPGRFYGELGSIENARFVGPNHIIATTKEGVVVLWELRQAKITWYAAGDLFLNAAFSANRRYVAFCASDRKEIAIVECLTGKLLGHIPHESPNHLTTLSFKPDGRQLAVLTDDRLVIWDLTTAQRVADLALPGFRGPVNWPSEGFLMVGKTLISLEKQCALWNYGYNSARPVNQCFYSGRSWFVNSARGEPRVELASIALPHPPAKAAASGDLSSRMAIKPGDAIAVDVDLAGEDKAKVTSALTAKLMKNGYKISPQSPVQLTVRSQSGASKTLPYGGPGKQQNISVTETNTWIEIKLDDKTLWKRNFITSAPFMLEVKEDQTLEQAVQAAMKPNYKWAETVYIPKYLPKPDLELGASRIFSTHIEEKKSK